MFASPVSALHDQRQRAPARSPTRGTTRRITSRSCSPNSSPPTTSPARTRSGPASSSARRSGGWRSSTRSTCSRSPSTPACRSPVALKIPTDRRTRSRNDMGLFVQDKWTIGRATINAGVRYDQFIGATNPETLPAGTFNPAVTYSALLGRQEQPERRLHGTRHELEGHQPARRRRVRRVRRRQDGDQGERRPLRRRHRSRGRRHRSTTTTRRRRSA